MASDPKGTFAVVDLVSARTGRSDVIEIAENVAFRRFGGLTLLEWCVRRLSESALLDGIVITGQADCGLKVLSGGLYGATWMASTQPSAASRALEVIDQKNARWLLFASPTCPFMDPVLLDRLIASAWSVPDSDYVGFVSPGRPRFSLGSLGLVGEICSHSAIRRLDRISSPNSLLSVPSQLRNNPDLFQLRLQPLPSALDRGDYRFALETEEDWEKAYTLLDAAGDDLSWQRLAALAEHSSPRAPMGLLRSKSTSSIGS